MDLSRFLDGEITNRHIRPVNVCFDVEISADTLLFPTTIDTLTLESRAKKLEPSKVRHYTE